MHIALTGASGFIGSTISKLAVQQGHTVTALVRETSNRAHIEQYVSKFIIGTHDDDKSVASLMKDADVVIHNSFDWSLLKNYDLNAHLSTNLQGSIKLLEMSESRPFIYISSIAVHHFMHDKWNHLIDEAHPSRPGSIYGACKAAVEAHLWPAHATRGQSVSAIRPCAVYGIDPNLSRSIGWPIVQSIKQQKPFTKQGGGKFVHVDDVAAATIACINNPKASPSVYNLVDCYARWADLATMASQIIGCDVDIDMSSPSEPTNTFNNTKVNDDLGVSLNRGLDGLRQHIEELVSRSSE